MGITYVEIEVGDPGNGERWETVTALVDTGSLMSVIPEPILRRLNVVRRGTQTFRLADGSLMTRDKGIAAFRWGPREGGADVVFGEADDAVLLGALTLESLGLGIHPLRHELVEIPMVV